MGEQQPLSDPAAVLAEDVPHGVAYLAGGRVGLHRVDDVRHHVLRPLGGVPERRERVVDGSLVALLSESLDALALAALFGLADLLDVLLGVLVDGVLVDADDDPLAGLYLPLALEGDVL